MQSEAKKGEDERDREKGRRRDRGREEEKEETEESIWREGGVRKKEDTRVVTIRGASKRPASRPRRRHRRHIDGKLS